MRAFGFFSKNNGGFTLIETLVVLALIAIMSAITLPRFTSFFNSDRENTAIATSLIVRTFDDAFINGNINYLTFHLYDSLEEETENMASDIFSRRNAMSVLRLEEGVFTDAKREILKARQFSSSFRIEEAVISSGEIIASGSLIVPFYPGGYSDNVIIHVLLNDDRRISIKIRKYMKEPEVLEGYVSFEGEEA